MLEAFSWNWDYFLLDCSEEKKWHKESVIDKTDKKIQGTEKYHQKANGRVNFQLS